MIVDVQDRDAPSAGGDGGLGGDRGGVEVAIAADIIGPAWWPGGRQSAKAVRSPASTASKAPSAVCAFQ
jgi:hypothetical protein